MKLNKYEKTLLDNSSYLDTLTKSGGEIVQCVRSVIEHNDESALKLCKLIEVATELKDVEVTKIAKAVKDSLIDYYGYKQLSNICSANELIEEDYTLEELMSQLNNLVGLENVKSKVNDLIAYQRVQLLRKKNGLHSPNSTMHMAFTGNPGTGKTTVARIVGRIYKAIGLLSKGHFMEVSRTDLIAGYQGQTAHKVKDVIEKAKGGVLFIDEAYSITENDHSDSYGRECLTELTKALEDYREDLVVIVAGYTEPMKQFFSSNPGLKSRFNTFIEFEDYSAHELVDIFNVMCHTDDYIPSTSALELLHEYINQVLSKNEPQFANGRFIRNIYEDIVMNHARRVSVMQNPLLNDLQELLKEDVRLNN